MQKGNTNAFLSSVVSYYSAELQNKKRFVNFYF